MSSHGLFAFHLDSHYWIEFPSFPQDLSTQGLARYLHTSAIFGKYMLVYGKLLEVVDLYFDLQSFVSISDLVLYSTSETRNECLCAWV